MATEWYWREAEIDKGPVSFRDLVTMVRDQILTENDPVRPHYSSDWQEAGSVVGLFHMAGRGEVLARWEEERRQAELARLELQGVAESIEGSRESISLDDIEGMLSFAQSMPESEEPIWRVRLREIDELRAEEERESHDELVAGQFQDLKDQAIAAAIAKMDSKEAVEKKRWRWSISGEGGSREILRRGFQWGLTIVVANLAAVGILSWSKTESMRFPNLQTAASRMQNFPMWGECTPGVYAFLLIDAVLIAAILAYAGSRFLVSLTDK